MSDTVEAETPETIYHFTQAEFGIQAILGRRLKVSLPLNGSLNDPNEWLFAKDSGDEENSEQEIMQEFLKYGCFVSFSGRSKYSDEVGLDPIFDPVMWAHYGSSKPTYHDGIALGFEHGNCNTVRLIDYTNERPSYKSLDKNGGSFSDIRFKKSLSWKYESEYRVAYDLNETRRATKIGKSWFVDDPIKTVEALDDKDTIYFAGFHSPLKEVVLGPNCSFSVEDILKMIVGLNDRLLRVYDFGSKPGFLSAQFCKSVRIVKLKYPDQNYSFEEEKSLNLEIKGHDGNTQAGGDIEADLLHKRYCNGYEIFHDLFGNYPSTTNRADNFELNPGFPLDWQINLYGK